MMNFYARTAISLGYWRALYTMCAFLLFSPLALAQLQTYATPGNYQFQVPDGVTSLTVQAYGGGAGGAAAVQFGIDIAGRGGGGGAYASSVVAVIPGNFYSVTVGAGGGSGGNGENSIFGNPVLVRANGGTGQDGGQASASIGTVVRNGGNGAGAYGGFTGVSNAGGGGGGAGTNFNGGNGGQPAAGTGGTVGGGNGGAGRTNSGAGNAASATGYGGGGGGGRGGTNAGGAGRSGAVIISWTPPPACAGLPAAGTIPTTFTPCPGNAVTIAASGTEATTGLTFAWQEFNGTDWVAAVDGSGANTLSYTTPALNSPKQYRLNVTCTNSGQSSQTNTATVTPTLVGACYCAAAQTSGCGSGDAITRVVLETLDNSSGCTAGSYTLYNSLTVPALYRTVSYSIAITMGAQANQFSAVWVDWNQNGVYESGEQVLPNFGNAGTNGTATLTINVPIDAVLGQTFLRVRGGNRTQPTNPCGNNGSNFGEIEDYRVNILELPSCSGTPAAGTIPGSSTPCPGATLAINATGVEIGAGIVRQWEQFNGTNWVNAIGGSVTNLGSTSTYTTPALTSPIQYRLNVTCTNSGLSSQTGSMTVTPTVVGSCYCAAAQTSGCGTDFISRVQLGALDNSSGCTAGTYTFYNSVAVPDLVQTQSYTISITMGPDGNQFSAVWIDWNKNSVFEAGEQILPNFGNAGANGTAVLNINVPANAVPGLTMMRVRGGNDSQPSNPCGNNGSNFGEIEDYLVNILAPENCTGVAAVGATTGPSSVPACGSALLGLTNTPAPQFVGVTYEWQYGPSNTGPWENAFGTSSTFLTAVPENRWYRAVVTCTLTEDESISDPLFISSPGDIAPFPQNFASTTYPPDCWSNAGSSAGLSDRATVNAYGAPGSGSARFAFRNNGGTGFLTTPVFNDLLHGPGIISFDAAGTYSIYTIALASEDIVDNVFLEVSSNGGASWQTVVQMNNGPSGVLNTGSPTTGSPFGGAGTFTPNAAQWTSLSYDIPQGTNRIRLRGVQGTGLGANGGNNVYFDNLVLQTTCLGIPDAGVASIVGAPVGCLGQTLTMSSNGDFDSVLGLEFEWEVNFEDPDFYADEEEWSLFFEPLFDGDGLNSPVYTTAPQDDFKKYYRLRVTCPVSEETSFSNAVEVEVFEPPVLTLTSDPEDALICSSGSVELSVSGSDLDQYQWAPNTNIAPNNTASVVTVSPTVTTSYTVTGTDASGCTSTEGVLVRVEPNPTANTTTPPLTICEDGSIVLETQAAPVPALNFSAPVSVTGLSGNVNLPIPEAAFFIISDPGPVVSSSVPVVGGPYSPLGVTVQITTNHPRNSDLEFWLQGPGGCGAMTVSLRKGGNVGNYSNARFVAPPGNLPTAPVNSTPLTGIYRAEGNLNLGATIPGVGTFGPLSGCPVSGNWTLFVRDVNKPSALQDTQGSLVNWQVTVQQPGTGDYTHEVVSGPGTIGPVSTSGTSNSLAQFEVSDLAVPGGNLSWTVRTTAPTGCFVESSVTSNITVIEQPTVATVGGTQNICVNSTTAGLGGNTPVVGTGAWSVVSGGTGTFSNASDPDATFTHTGGAGPVLLRWTISSPPCAASTADVSITITPQTTVSNAGPEQNGICSFPGTTTLAANTPAQGVGSWSQTGGPLTATIADATSPNSGISGMTTGGTYTFAWTISNSPCVASVGTVAINVTEADIWYDDSDNDGFGDPAITVLACAQPPGFVANNSDNCPLVFGVVGTFCDANPDPNAFTFGALDEDCECVTQNTTEDLLMVVQTDANPAEITWEIVLADNPSLILCSGTTPGSAVNQTVFSTCSLPEGCFNLRVYDEGEDGITVGNQGGYVLRYQGMVAPNQDDKRIIDNTRNFNGVFDGGLSAIGSGPSAFCLPMSTQKPLYHHRDRIDFVSNEYLVCEEDIDVSAQWQVGDQTLSGYQFWFFDPNGSFSYRRGRTHAASDGFANIGPARTCHMKINNWPVANQIPDNVLMNVRIRTRVNGTYGDFGPAYRFKIDPIRAQCPLTKLLDYSESQFESCNQTRNWGTGNWVHARAVQGANRYQWRFRIPAENFVVAVTSNNYFLQLNWVNNPLQAGKTYVVDVRASKDGGATWCSNFIAPALNPWGDLCNLTIAASAQGDDQNMVLNSTGDAMSMWPNPNRSEQLWLNVDGIEAGVQTVTVDIFDMTGKRIVGRIIPSQGDHLSTVLDLNGDLAAGLYIVNVTAGNKTWNQRLVIAR